MIIAQTKLTIAYISMTVDTSIFIVRHYFFKNNLKRLTLIFILQLFFAINNKQEIYIKSFAIKYKQAIYINHLCSLKKLSFTTSKKEL